MTDFSSIIARLEAADGPDREIDAAIAAALLPDCYLPDASDECAPGTHWFFPPSRGRSLHTSERYTTSLDACLALQERVLPGWTRDVDATAPECGVDVGLHYVGHRCMVGKHRGGSEPIAWLIAILRAVEAERAEKEVAE